MVPDAVGKLIKRGAQIEVEAGLGLRSGHADAAYTAAGANVVSDHDALLSSSDMILRLHKPSARKID